MYSKVIQSLYLVTQLCLTLCEPVDYSPPVSSIHGESPGKNTQVGCYAILQGIFPPQGSNPGHLNCRWILYQMSGDSLVAQRVKSLPAMRETQIRSLGQEDPLEKEMATHSSILAWKVPWTEELGRLQSMGLQRVGHDWVTWLSFSYIYFSD